MLRLFFSALLSLVILGLFRVKSVISTELRFVPYCKASIAALVITMAVISKQNAHPDEIIHLNNAIYYSQHPTPAVACSQETRFTYSTYGVSRLDKREIDYYLGGRYLHL